MEKSENKLKWNVSDTVMLLITLIPICYAMLRYSDLPNQMAIHFDANWEADGFQSKSVFLVWFSILILILPILMKWMPRLDPKGNNYYKFSPFYNLFRLIMSVFLAALYMLTLLYNLDYAISFKLFTNILLGTLWILIGNYMGQIRPNYTFGIKTPWTLANEDVWRKTHRASGPLWMVVGLLFLAAAFFEFMTMGYVLIVGLIISILVPFLLSYMYYAQLKK